MTTVFLDLDDPLVLQQTYPVLFDALAQEGKFGLQYCTQPCSFLGGADSWAITIVSFEHSFPPGTIVIEGAPPVPEPATWLLLLIGFAAVALAMRARRAQRAGARRPGWKPGRHLLPIALKRL